MLRSKLRPMPIWAIYLAVSLVLVVLNFQIPSDDVSAAGHAVKDPAEATLAVLQEMMKLVLSLNTAMLAAAGTLVIKGEDWLGEWTGFEHLLLVSVFLSGVVAYFGVYSCHMAILSMVNASSIYPLETSLMWSLRLQYFGLIVGAFLLGLVFSMRIGHARPDKRG